ncbi:metallophosphoesterase [Streptomyces sp. t39]|uniref:metallophosphoesterase n=1 Tax=Streptomyces sp. t39 TaxID=1828156 RepID=UPI0011CD775F|nr:metallophosphoesterase [Streptomyces sp. t39]TXS56551.1 metallophosphoesterase [Streptomyces sp. t39]
MVAVAALVIILVLALLAGVHWYVWRRLVRDTTVPGGRARRIGTVALWALPALSFGALLSARVGAPFWVEQVLAWPGYLWLALLLYVVLALVVGEAVRPLLTRALARRASARGAGNGPAASGAAPAAGAAQGSEAPAGTTTRAPGAAAPAGAALAGATGSAPEAGAGGTTTTAPAPDGAAREGATAAAPADGAPAPDPSAPASAPAGGGTTAPDVDAPEADAPAAVSRRMFVSRIVGGAAAAAAVGTVGYGTYGVLRGPRVKRVTVPLAKLPRGAHGYRIAVVSDVHLGPILGRGHTQRIVDAINAAQPDLVAVVGDLVDGSVADLGHAAEPLAQLKARDGSFFVTGNHEYFSGADEWVDHVRELGLKPLRNERVEIAGGFDLAGVDDIAGEDTGQGPDFARALGDRDRSRAAVLLAHQPVVIHDAVDHGVDLQLSGHTHGGQLWPGNLLAGLANPTVAGLERYGDTQLYVSRGAGAWGPPVRVGAESDITVVQLASRQA